MASSKGKGRDGKANAGAQDSGNQSRTTAHDYAHPDGFVPRPTQRNLRLGSHGGAFSRSAGWSGDEDNLPKRIILERRPSLHHKGKSSYKVQAPGTPFDELDLSEVDFLRHDLADFQLEPIKRGLTRYRRLFFVIGILFGALVAWAIASHQQVEYHMQHLMSTVEEQFSGMGIDFSSLDFKMSMPSELTDLGDKLFTGPGMAQSKGLHCGQEAGCSRVQSRAPRHPASRYHQHRAGKLDDKRGRERLLSQAIMGNDDYDAHDCFRERHVGEASRP